MREFVNLLSLERLSAPSGMGATLEAAAHPQLQGLVKPNIVFINILIHWIDLLHLKNDQKLREYYT